MNLILNDKEIELLLAFEAHIGLEALSQYLGRDPTVISRQLKRISQKGDFLTKVSGKWTLTQVGQKMNQLSRDYIISQNKILQREVHLTVGTTREFAANVLSPHILEFKKALGIQSVTVMAFEDHIETALKNGEIDLGIDCGRPYSPDILYKRILDEPIVPVATKIYMKKVGKIKNWIELGKFPHILCHRLNPDRVSRNSIKLQNIVAHTNDIASARAMCLAGAGWALLPKYTIQGELRNKQLVVINNLEFSFEKFGVWQLRSREHLKIWTELTAIWMKTKGPFFRKN